MITPHFERVRSHLSSTLSIGIFVVGCSIWAAACTPDSTEAPETCAEIVDTAARQVELEDQVEWFDTAISSCGSYDEVVNEIERKGRVVGYSVEEFVRRRCTDSEPLATTDVCIVAAPPTTLVESIGDPVYIGSTLDGREIEVTPDDVDFVGNEPKVIARTVELAGDGGPGACIAVLGVRDDFASFVRPENIGDRDQDIASMYAQHAQLVADFLGCISEAVPTVPPSSTPSTTAAP